MDALTARIRSLTAQPMPSLTPRAAWALGLSALVVAVGAASPGAFEVVLGALSDAYIQVSAFVAATLALFYGLERLLGVNAETFLKRHARWQSPIAALLGALPGCGGAIVVTTQFVRGHISFGALFATLTATMGDAAFLLLAKDPRTGLAVFALGFAVGAISGYVVDAVHGPGFLRQHNPSIETSLHPASPAVRHARSHSLNRLWAALMVPGLLLAVLTAFQVDVDALLRTPLIAEPALLFGAIGALLSVGMWAFAPSGAEGADEAAPACSQGGCSDGPRGLAARVIADTNFVTAWVVLAFLAFELTVHVTGVELDSIFALPAVLAPLAGVLVGFLPGCGPQVVVTTLYLAGAIPLSAQIGNAISNDGDALFPAIALAPKAAVLATVYSAVPALIVGYGYWRFFE